MKQGWENLKKFVNENPVAAIIVASLAANAAAKVLHEVVAAKSARTHAREIDRRYMKL